MKGRNEMVLNVATVQEAIQYWLNNVVWRPDAGPVPTVVGFTSSGGITPQFTVQLDSEKSE